MKVMVQFADTGDVDLLIDGFFVDGYASGFDCSQIG